MLDRALFNGLDKMKQQGQALKFAVISKIPMRIIKTIEKRINFVKEANFSTKPSYVARALEKKEALFR